MTNSKTYQKLLTIHALANQILNNSSITYDVKYDLIFSDKISLFVFDFFKKINMPIEYYDPDTSYQEDVEAFMNAFNEKMESLNNPETIDIIHTWLSL